MGGRARSRGADRTDTRRGHGRESPSSNGPSVAGGSVVSRQPSVQREAVVQRQPPVQGPGAVSTQGRRSKGWCACRGGGSVSSSQLFSEIGGRGQRACSREAESRRGWAGGVSRIHHAGQSCRVRRTIAGSSRAPHPHVVPARPKTDKLQVTPAPPPTRMPIHLICNKR